MATKQLRLLDTLSNEFFEPDSSKPISIYICGPTVYTYTHIGHLKTYMTFDIIRRILEDYFRLTIRMAMNITNVDDKIIRGTYQREYGFDDKFDLNDLKESQYLDKQKFIGYADSWEQEFFKNMDLMNIRRPNVVGRVTEYTDEILEFVDMIDSRGMAFEDNGSVYFYGTKYNNIMEADGSYSKDPSNEHNFCLLKKLRPYESGWETRWKSEANPKGIMRFGWHSECSTIATKLFGTHIDIHCGGIDLKFPHHHNEMQQSNCVFKDKPDDPEWVSHFMHQGHLNIEGFKMSRSLKNFITVKEISSLHTPNQIRMLFLLHQWASSMDYSEDTMKEANFFDDYFNNLFIQGQSILLRKTTTMHKKFGPIDQKYADVLTDHKIKLDRALKDNINTLNAIKVLHGLGGNMFSYVKYVEEIDKCTAKELILDTLDFIKKMLEIFGLTYSDVKSNDDKLIGVISTIRTDIRDLAKEVGVMIKPLDKDLAKRVVVSLYDLTDRIRDSDLPAIGIKLTDK